MKMSNYIEPSTMSAEAKSSIVDGEVLGQDADGGLIHWNATAGAPYNSGQTVEEFGISNLSDAELKRLILLKYTRSSEDSRGLHIVFGEPVTPANFLAACNAAIDLAKIECSTQTAVAIVFEAKGVEVQVTETDSAEVQLALWERKLSNYIETPHQSAVDKGLLLRTKALALLQEAQAVDGLKPFTVTHTHSFGESTYVLWAAETPTQEQAEAVLDSEFEPDREETLVVEDCFSLEEMSGVAVTARLPDILESLRSPGQDDSPSP